MSIIEGYLSDVAAASDTTGNVFGVATQYYQQVNGVTTPIQYSVTAGSPIPLSDPFPTPDAASGCPASLPSGYRVCVSDTAERSELQTIPGLSADDAHLYMMFLPPGVETCSPENEPPVACSATDFCGYHSAFFLNQRTTSPVIYANMPYAQVGGPGQPTCGDPFNGAQAPNGDQFADAEVSVISHEANESITDWDGDTWTDVNSNEEADQCAYVYGNPLGGNANAGTLYNQVVNRKHYYTQEEFSNSDYAFGQGSVLTPGFVGQVAGCVQRPTLSTSFTPVAGAATDISVGANGEVWVIGTNAVKGGRAIYRLTGAGWVLEPGGGVDIAVGPDGNPWVVNSTQQIYSWNGSGWVARPGAAHDVTIGGDGTPFVIGTNPVGGGNFGIYVWSSGSWFPLSGGGVTISGGPDGLPWVNNAAHQIYRLTVQGQALVWTRLSGAATNIGVGDLAAWVVGTNSVGGGHGIYHLNGTSWVRVPGGAVSIAAGPDGNPWVINSAHQIYN
jgi:hypothetical protein